MTCETECASSDIIPILPTADTDIARLALRTRTLQENGLTHSLKKASGGGKKRKKRDQEVDVAVDGGKEGTPKASAPARGEDTSSTRINNSATASITAKVLQEQEAKRRKTENDNVKSLFSSRDPSKPHGKSSDFMTRGFTVPAGGKT